MPPRRSYPALLAALALSACASTPTPPSAPEPPALAGRLGSRFPTFAGHTTIPFELVDNRIWVDVHVNHAGPFRFVLDTGASNCMTPALAARLALTVHPEGFTRGAGGLPAPYATAEVAGYTLGDTQDVVLTDQAFGVLDLTQIQRAFGFAAFDGLVGFEVLAQHAVRVDFEAQRLTFIRDLGPQDVEGFTAVPFTLFGDTHPVIAATIEGVPARVLIDTGDRSALTILTAFLAHPDVAARFAGAPEPVTGVGIGGPIPAQLGHVETLAFGGFTFRDVVARHPTLKGGFNAFSAFDATIGNEVLRHFTVLFDYQTKVVYLRPNRHFAAPTRFTPVPHLDRVTSP